MAKSSNPGKGNNSGGHPPHPTHPTHPEHPVHPTHPNKPPVVVQPTPHFGPLRF